MSFKFMHSKIDTRSAVPSLSEVVKLAQTKKALAVKTASAQAPAKVAKKTKAEEVVADEDGGEETEEKGAFPGAAPKFKKKESKASTKVAEKEEGESSGQPEAEAKLVNEPKKPEGAKGTGGGKGGKGGESDEADSSGQLDVEPLHQKGESTGESAGGLDTQKGGEGKKEAKTNARFVRVAELTDKQKEFLRATWSLYWPKSFIDALLAAK